MSNSARQHFSSLIEPHLDALFRTAYRLARNQPDAQDLVQETCVRAYQRISELDQSRHVKGWLLRVLHNLFIDSTRRAQSSPVTGCEDNMNPLLSPPSTDPNPEESTYATQREEQLQRAWSKLERGQRALLALRAEGFTLFEIAEIADVPMGALNARLYRARQSFARYLKDDQAKEPENRKEIFK
jgi:RNA polymerase sigma-70 factor (ECF subfamily)